MTSRQSLTSVPLSPAEERHIRMVRYSIAMAIRMVCVVAMVFVSGWWLVLCAVGAVFLPYFAVVVANQQRNRIVTRRVAPDAHAIAAPLTVTISDWSDAPR